MDVSQLDADHIAEQMLKLIVALDQAVVRDLGGQHRIFSVAPWRG